LLIATFFAIDAQANNNLFLPGDAFFHCVLNKVSAARLSKSSDEPRSFRYSNEGAEFEGAFCGFAGYGFANIEKVDDKFAKNLAKAYAQIRESSGRRWHEIEVDGKTKLVESNPAHIFFYNADFDFKKHHIGLRYNEDWIAQVLKFGHSREHMRLCCFVGHKDAAAMSWRDADLVPGLSAVIPNKAPERGRIPTEPITISGNVKAIVLPPVSLSKYFASKESLSLFVVDSNGIKKYARNVFRPGPWTAVPD